MTVRTTNQVVSAVGDRSDSPVSDSPGPSDAIERSTYVLGRLEEQRTYYNRSAKRDRLLYQVFKIIQLVLAAAVPVAASLHSPAAVTGSFGASIVVLEGIQQLFQWHSGWIRYRTAAEQLRHERFIYLARVGDYAATPTPVDLLAERLEDVNSLAKDRWAETFAAPTEKTS